MINAKLTEVSIFGSSQEGNARRALNADVDWVFSCEAEQNRVLFLYKLFILKSLTHIPFFVSFSFVTYTIELNEKDSKAQRKGKKRKGHTFKKSKAKRQTLIYGSPPGFTFEPSSLKIWFVFWKKSLKACDHLLSFQNLLITLSKFSRNFLCTTSCLVHTVSAAVGNCRKKVPAMEPL